MKENIMTNNCVYYRLTVVCNLGMIANEFSILPRDSKKSTNYYLEILEIYP